MWHLFANPSPIAIKGMAILPRWLIHPNLSGSRNFGASLLLALSALIACNSVFASEVETQAKTKFLVDFKQQSASSEVRHIADWVMDSRDNLGMPFVIIDKVNAKVFVFDARGQLLGADAALLGMGRGDLSSAEIGGRKMSGIRPQDRNTPAGRFLVVLDHDIHGKEILLIDYAASIALHPIVKGTPAENRAQRMQTETAQDNRISYGCINVPVKFYEKIISPVFTRKNGFVYILPETSKASELFETSGVGSNTSL
jgi:hypothetical protein